MMVVELAIGRLVAVNQFHRFSTFAEAGWVVVNRSAGNGRTKQQQQQLATSLLPFGRSRVVAFVAFGGISASRLFN